ncbi:MAG: pilus assembly protein TadG-related protein, partial [Paracoccaceae bacterium]|nr:pilus assembly protein TadG-related protein [Paracoccaceae bacterium]
MGDILRAFARSETGSITLLWLILIPAFLLVGGFATDIAMINAQKRYVQAQADLSAQSAVHALPDLAQARSIAQEVVTLNGKYGDITLGQGDVLFGHFDTASNRFVAAADQADPSGVNAVKVSVPSGYDPFLLGPVMARDDYVIRRAAVAAQRAAIAFTLRNRLLGVDTSQSVLDPLLSNLLGLGTTVQVLGYQGLANAGVGINELLGLLSARVGAGVVTFDDILNLPISLDTFLGGLKDLGALPEGVSSSSGNSLSLGSILAISPEALQANIGRILPDLKLNVFDLLMAVVSLNG